MIVAKFKDRVVQIVKVAETVEFSKHREWILVCFDFHKPMRKRDHIRWIRASESSFDWVREFEGE